MNEPESSNAFGPPRIRGMCEIRAEGSRLTRQVLLPAERFIYSGTISGVGVTGYAWLAVRLGWATLPGGVAWAGEP